MVWLVGGASLITVVSVAWQHADAKHVAELLRQSNPWLLGLAILLQCGTYSSESLLWRGVTCRAGCHLTFLQGLRLSLAKLFIDQALPTGGVSGSVLAVSALNRRGISRGIVAASIVVERSSFLFAFALALFVAAGLGFVWGRLSVTILGIAVLVSVGATAVAAALVALSGDVTRLSGRLRRVSWAKGLVDLLHQADLTVVRRRRLFVFALGLQLSVIALDTLTMVTLVRALGGRLPLAAVFVSFMMSSLFRTIGILPGGLGTFEASSILTLKMAGAPTGLALSATLAFRLLSFWLPLIPGLIFARRIAKHVTEGSAMPAIAPARAAHSGVGSS